jgi:topoisomerase-4 subunit A
LKTFIKKELRVIIEEFGDKRRCQIISDVQTAQAFNDQDMVPAENVTVVLSEKGWVKAAKGHEIDPISLNYKAGDTYLQDAKGKSNKMAFFIDSTGRSYTLLASSFPSARGQGEPLTGRLTPPIGAEFIDMVMGDDDQLVLLASDVGYGFISNLGNLKSKTKSGKNAITLPSKSKVMKIVLVEDLETQYVAVATNRGRLLIFPIVELPLLSKGKGNKLIQIPAIDLAERKEIVTGLCALNETQKLRVYYGKRKTPYKPEDWIYFVSHRARRGKELRPGYVTNIMYIEAED